MSFPNARTLVIACLLRLRECLNIMKNQDGDFPYEFTVRNPINPERTLQLEGLVDTGTHFTQVPGQLLEQIGVVPFGARQIQYANGPIVSKPVASAEILVDQQRTPAVILCGNSNDLILIGATTLENLNFGVDPVHKKLIPLIAPQT
jgi:predicted aspartyl protease